MRWTAVGLAAWVTLASVTVAGQTPVVDTAARVAVYEAFLAKLPPGKPESILKARDELLTYLTGENRCGDNAGCAQAVFDRFDTFYQRVIAECNHALYANTAAQRVLGTLVAARN